MVAWTLPFVDPAEVGLSSGLTLIAPPPVAEAGVCDAPAEGGPSSLFTSIPEPFPASDKSRFFTVVLAYLADLLD